MAIDPNEFAQLHANAVKYVSSQKKQPKGRSGIAKFLPAAGAVGAGLIAAPFTGGLSLAATLATLAAAGAVGSAAGEFGAQKANREKTNLGKVGKEAVLGGALSAIPLGGFGRAAQVSRAAEAGVVKGIPAKLASGGQRLESRAGGYGQGTKLSNGQRLKPSQVKEMKALDRTERIPSGHPDDQGKVIEVRLAHANTQLDDAIKNSNRRLAAGENKKLRQGLISEINSNTAIKGNTQAQKRLAELDNSWKNVTTVKGAVKAKRDLQELINHGRNTSSATPVVEQVNSTALKTLNKFINSEKVAPEIGNANKRVSGLIQRQDLSLAESSNLKNQSVQAGGGIAGRFLTGDTAQTVKSRAGNLAQKIAGEPGNVRPGGLRPGGGTLTEALKQTGGRAVGTGFGPTPPPEDSEDNADNLINMPGAVGPYDSELGGVVAAPDPYAESMDDFGNPTQADSGQAGPATLEQALLQAQSILGPDQTPATYLSYAKAIQASTKGSAPSATQQKTQNALKNATNVIDEIESAYKTVGGAQGAVQGTARNLAGKVRLDQDANYYNSQRQGYLSRIARAFGEVGTLSDQDIARAVNLIPDLADNPQNAARKLAGLRNLLAQAQQTNTGGGNQDIVDAILQAQGAY